MLLLAACGGLSVSVNIAPPYGSSDRSQVFREVRLWRVSVSERVKYMT